MIEKPFGIKSKKLIKNKLFHPDKNNAEDATERFKDICEAYTELSKEYEEGKLKELFHADPKAIFTRPPVPRPLEKFAYFYLCDSMKNALYAYYEARIGQRVEKPTEEEGFDTIRTMLCHILGISAFGTFNIEVQQCL